jgi:hypothetical protein
MSFLFGSNDYSNVKDNNFHLLNLLFLGKNINALFQLSTW